MSDEEIRYRLRFVGLERYYDPTSNSQMSRGEAPDFSAADIEQMITLARSNGHYVFKEEVPRPATSLPPIMAVAIMPT